MLRLNFQKINWTARSTVHGATREIRNPQKLNKWIIPQANEWN